MTEIQNNQNETSDDYKKIKEAQNNRDFDDVIKIFENLSSKEQQDFVNDLSLKDKEFAKLYGQLNSFIWNKVKSIDKWIIKPKNETIETQSETTNKLIETQSSYLEKNTDFKPFVNNFEEKNINWNNIVVLKEDTYNAYSRYSSNKEPLAKILAKEELRNAKLNFDSSIKASNNMPYAPQNMNESKLYAEKQYNQNVKSIIEKYTPIADKFVNLLNNSDIWKDILSNTALNNFDTKLKQNINKNISWEDNTNQEKLSNSIEIKTKTLIWKMSSLQNQLNKEISDFKNWSQENLKQRDYITWERILYNDLPKRFEGLITKEIDNYAREVWKELVLSNSNVITQWSVFNLPIWDKEVVLDFSELWNTLNKNTTEKLKLYENNFNKIYKNSLVSKIWRELTSKKWLVDISWIIIWWAMATKFSAWTWGAWIPAATVIFTWTENAYRAWMYQALGIEKWWSDWIWIDLENDKASDIFRKKWFELVSNWVLFSLFRVSWIWKDVALKYMWNPNFTEKLSWKIITSWIKTTTEATFFTYYTIVSNNLQESIKNWWNSKEMLESFTKVWNMNDFMKLFAYNLWFITMVKTWWKMVDLLDKNKVSSIQKDINTELKTLQWKWYFLIWDTFYKWNNKVDKLPADFQSLTELNKKLWDLINNSYIKPESWRAWKTINTNQVNANKKYENLEKYSTQTREWKISYALNDRTIWDNIQINWLQNWKWVWEWLLKKSWFSNEEITKFREWKLKWEKPNETKAINEMNKAMEVVYREYIEIKNVYSKWWNIKKEFPQLSDNTADKIILMFRKEMFSEDNKKEDK